MNQTVTLPDDKLWSKIVNIVNNFNSDLYKNLSECVNNFDSTSNIKYIGELNNTDVMF